MTRGTVFVGTEIFAAPLAEPAEVLRTEGFQIRLNPFHRLLKKEDYPKCLSEVDYVLAGLEPYDAAVFSSYPRLRVVSRIGIGVNSIDLDAARAHEVHVYNTPEAPSRSVAELTIGFLVCLLRGIMPMNQQCHQQAWTPSLGREIAHVIVGLLGFGRIGGLVAQRLQTFGSRVLACDPRWDEEKAARWGVTRVGFEELLAASDVVSLHLPLDPSTAHLIRRPQLDAMKQGAWLINTSRGGIVDDAALIERLRSGRLAGAALDVFETEPDLRRYAGVPNLLMSPHVGSHTVEARHRMEMGAVRNLLAYVRAMEHGRTPPPGPLQ
jgi:D-3-phosphoglycerate dehydrogenase